MRSQMAESILIAKGGHDLWDVWSTPVQDKQERTLVQNVLAEIGIPLNKTPQTTQPSFGLSWDQGVIMCSGMADA